MIKVVMMLWLLLVFVTVVGLMPSITLGEFYIAGTTTLATIAVCLVIKEKEGG